MGKVKINVSIVLFYFFSIHYSMSKILPKDSSKVSYTQKLTASEQFDNFAKRTLRANETGPSRIHQTNPNIHIPYAKATLKLIFNFLVTIKRIKPNK